MTTKWRIALVGPMSNVGNYNFPLFDTVAERFRATGCEVYNPADTARDFEVEKLSKQAIEDLYRTLLRTGLEWICDKANVIYLLPGWEQSEGAKAERQTAIACKKIQIWEAESNIVIMDTGAKK